jgi:hypothetical protein
MTDHPYPSQIGGCFSDPRRVILTTQQPHVGRFVVVGEMIVWQPPGNDENPARPEGRAG